MEDFHYKLVVVNQLNGGLLTYFDTLQEVNEEMERWVNARFNQFGEETLKFEITKELR